MASLSCAFCSRGFTSSSNLKRHWDHVHGRKQCCCPECGKSFGRQDDLLRHWRNSHDAGSASQHHPAKGRLNLYDDMGRVTASDWTIEGQRPSCPPFMINAIQSLKHQFPDTRMASYMYLCPVHRLHHMPILRPIQPLDEKIYVQQYVPTIECLDCPDEYLLIPSSQVLGIAEEHFRSKEHIRKARFRRVAESGIFREALFRALPLGSRQRKAMADITVQELSLSELDTEVFMGESNTLVILAAKSYPIEVLQFFLEEKLNIFSVDQRKRSGLHWASEMGIVDKAELLIQHGLRLHVRDAQYQTPLDLAVGSGGIDFAIRLVEAESQVESSGSALTSSTPLVIACRCDRLDVVQRLFERGANVNESDASGPLEIATRWGSPALVRFLLERGARTSDLSGQDIVLLEKRRDRFYTGPQPLYRDAEEKISLLKQYGLVRGGSMARTKRVLTEQIWIDDNLNAHRLCL